jgi:hypothetical protein
MRTLTQLKSALAEMKRRKVFRVGSLYLVAAWGASLGAAELFPAFGVPPWGVRAFVISAFLGFPLAVALAWAYEITADGVVRDLGERTAPPVPREQGGEDTTISATTRADMHTVRVSWQAERRSHVREFQRNFIIGRDAESDIRLFHDKISRQHARVHFDQGRWWVTDLGSRNGTYLNGRLISEASPLNATNEIALSKGGPVVVVSVFQSDGETVLDDPYERETG